MDLFHKIMALVDKNSGNIPEGDYLQLCNTIQELREHVKPPSFLDQTRPTWISEHDPERDGPPIYEPTFQMGNHVTGWMMNYHLTLIPLPNETENNFINTGEKFMKRLRTQVSTSFYNS